MSAAKDKVRCAALYRVSTARQAARRGEGDESLPVQRTAVRRFVDEQSGWELVSEFAEEGVSAYRNSSEDRDILQDVLRQAAKGQFDVLLVFKADRLSRQSFEYPFILNRLIRSGVRVIAVADERGGRELRVEGQTDKLIRFIEGWQAETESLNTSIRVSEAMRQMAQRGQWTGGKPPYGYRVDKSDRPSRLAVDEAEAACIHRMFDLYLEGNLGTPTVTYRLNADGYRQRNGQQWSDHNVRKIMQNPVLTGRMAYGRTHRGPGGRRVKGGAHSLEGVVLSEPQAHLVIVDRERWDRAMEKMQSYNNKPTPGNARYSRADSGTLLFTGMARCAHCGGAMISWFARDVKVDAQDHKTWSRRRMYMCQTKTRKGPEYCDGQRTYSSRKVESALMAAIRETLSSLDTQAIINEVRHQAEQTVWAQRTRLELAEKRLREATALHAGWVKRLDQFILNPEGSQYSETLLTTRVRELEDQIGQIRREIRDLETEHGSVAMQRRSLETFLAGAADWWERVLAAPRPEQKDLLKKVVEKVVIGRSGYEIHWRISPEAMAEGTVIWTQREAWPVAR